MPRDNQEYEEQKVVVKYLELIGAKFTSIPNSTDTNVYQRGINTASGLRAGLPDLFIIIKNQPFFIEMKRKKDGVVSEKQKEWIETINNCDGIKAYVCNGFEEAKKIIDNYKSYGRMERQCNI
jgi:hypothetical protein